MQGFFYSTTASLRANKVGVAISRNESYIYNSMSNFTKLKLNETYTFNGTLAQLEERILAMKRPRVETRKCKYRFIPPVSFGTLHFGWGKLLFINVDATIISRSDNIQNVTLTTEIRPEHYFLVCMCLFFIVTSNTTEMRLTALGISAFCFLVFHIIYRLQENEVVKCIEAQLDLIKA